MFRLTSDMIFELLTHLQPFQIQWEMKTKMQNLTCNKRDYNLTEVLNS